MRRCAIGLILSSILFPGALSAQDGRLQLAAHGGINGGSHAVVGVQAAVRVAKGVHLGITGVKVLGLEPAEKANLWDATIRFAPWSGEVRPSLLLGIGWVRESATATTRDERGIGFGLGIEVGRGIARPFTEARLIRVNRIFSHPEASSHGWLTAGIRLHLIQ